MESPILVVPTFFIIPFMGMPIKDALVSPRLVACCVDTLVPMGLYRQRPIWIWYVKWHSSVGTCFVLEHSCLLGRIYWKLKLEIGNFSPSG